MRYKPSPRYSDEFRHAAIQVSLTSPQTQAQLAAKLAIHPNTLSRWRKEWMMNKGLSDKSTLNAEPEKSVQELERDVKRLKKQLKRAELENSILKKADEYFVKHGK
ncbi:MAG: transposase [Halomonas sp.]|nr:transposase [Halomonas sp.]MDP3536262.1 transposase [Halomonas sp.]